MQEITIKNTKYGKKQPLGFILGPCVMESYTLLEEICGSLKENLPFPFIFKASFDKANRSSIDSFRGPGIETGLQYLQKIRAEFDVAITTDIHLPEHASIAAEVCDILQVPAFLARQTDLLVAAAKTMKPIHVKKAQFMAPSDMQHVAKKISSTGNEQIIFTDRGTSFGYHNLVNDFRSIPIMGKYCSATCYDVTHSGQLPGEGSESGGEKAFMEPLAKAAVAAGADMLFLETHPNPEMAKSDKTTQWPLEKTPALLNKLYALREHLCKEHHLAEQI
ncbi:3-deoxy-8-phosphooctulonate synthase [bacterium]|nr:3-deoxy-8-phosphooctulonate synthase [bacterium]